MSPHPFLSPPVSHLGPEFPVTRDRGWEPRPRSSSPASTTTERPMMSQTWGAHGAGARDPPQIFGVQGGPPSPPHSLTFRRESSMRKAARPSASAQMLPRSPACYGAEWGGQGDPKAPPPHPLVPGVPQAHPVLVLGSPVALPVRVEMVPAAVGGGRGVRSGCPRSPLGCPHSPLGSLFPTGVSLFSIRALPFPSWGPHSPLGSPFPIGVSPFPNRASPFPIGMSPFPIGVSLFPTGVPAPH